MEQPPITRPERLHKFLARAGHGGRRGCEELIRQGRVFVNGELVTRLGTVVDPSRDEVRLDGEAVRAEPLRYFVVYKPKGVVCTTSDQFGRTTVLDILGARRGRLFTVGRLEEDSEGLILVTNDGEFAQRVLDWMAPLRQTWYVRVRGRLAPEALGRLREGVWLSDGRTGPMDVRILRQGPRVSTLLVVPSSQEHRLLRRAFARVAVQVDRIVRVRIGPLGSRGLKARGFRELEPAEVAAILDPAAEHILAPRRRARGPARRGRAEVPSRRRPPARSRSRRGSSAPAARPGRRRPRP
jgi:23S rRNA pseudouridine2605 synthase